MGTTSKAFSLSTPAGSVAANTLDTVLQDDKTALNERYLLEHQTLVAAASTSDTAISAAGRHKPGQVTCCLVDTYANIAALTGIHSGCIAYATDKGSFYIYDSVSGSWLTYSMPVTAAGKSACDIRMHSSSLLLAATTWTDVPLNAAYYNPGTVFNVTTYRYTPVNSGYYFLSAEVEFSTIPSASAALQIRFINQAGTVLGMAQWYSSTFTTSDYLTLHLNTIAAIDPATQYTKLQAYSTKACRISGDLSYGGSRFVAFQVGV